MVIKIHQVASTKGAFNYNEKKVEEKHAGFFHSRNTISVDPFIHTKAHRLDLLTGIENRNNRVKNKCFHVSINPTSNELKMLSRDGLMNEIDTFMQQMGYGHQPYFVYEHADVDRTHYHIVSTRIDARSGKKISDSNEKRKASKFINELCQRHALSKNIEPIQKVNLVANVTGENLHESIQQVFKLLNQSNISGKQEYLDVLKAFNLQFYTSEKGQSVLIKQGEQTLRHAIPVSHFKEKPLYEACKENVSNTQLQKDLQVKVKQILQELNKSYRFYTESELTQALSKHNLLLYRRSENGNMSVYSPIDKTVVDAQENLKKYSIRLKSFKLSQDDFYIIIREYADLCQKRGVSILDELTTKENNQNIVNKVDAKITLKMPELSQIKHIKGIEDKDLNDIQYAVRLHFEYTLNKAKDKLSSNVYQVNSMINQQRCWERLNRQFIYELVHYLEKGNQKRNDLTKRKQNQIKKRKGKRY
ncbi:relaxase/mobilization nuclease domain-containing protein [Carboxylicivirga marina]|uniref:Relaxase/mobilization nuclease domain-containing protein n=1 Tax=Carboxylicivirga marina TaxID=2800988 RepID=A0ABS1HKR9_9BACT|nr:relaxase/mobilization nuclease domain-containing protein [Carboxylicivirga marina]MBK3518267.1 relaxase/mobilization nuclease domain-containing protein [Carboxylicivirga marina]